MRFQKYLTAQSVTTIYFHFVMEGSRFKRFMYCAIDTPIWKKSETFPFCKRLVPQSDILWLLMWFQWQRGKKSAITKIQQKQPKQQRKKRNNWSESISELIAQIRRKWNKVRHSYSMHFFIICTSSIRYTMMMYFNECFMWICFLFAASVTRHRNWKSCSSFWYDTPIST